MIISKLNEREELNHGNLVLRADNFSVSKYHWGKWEEIKSFLSEVESLYFQQQEDFDRNLCHLFVSLCKANTRLKEVKFFQDAANERHLICCLANDTKNVYEVPPFEASISLEMKKEKVKFSCVEYCKSSFKEDEEIKYPEHWQPKAELNSLFEKLYCFI